GASVTMGLRYAWPAPGGGFAWGRRSRWALRFARRKCELEEALFQGGRRGRDRGGEIPQRPAHRGRPGAGDPQRAPDPGDPPGPRPPRPTPGPPPRAAGGRGYPPGRPGGPPRAPPQ